MRLHIPLTEVMRVALLDLAASERRTPQQQAALLLERALLGEEFCQRVRTTDSEVVHAQTEG